MGNRKDAQKKKRKAEQAATGRAAAKSADGAGAAGSGGRLPRVAAAGFPGRGRRRRGHPRRGGSRHAHGRPAGPGRARLRGGSNWLRVAISTPPLIGSAASAAAARFLSGGSSCEAWRRFSRATRPVPATPGAGSTPLGGRRESRRCSAGPGRRCKEGSQRPQQLAAELLPAVPPLPRGPCWPGRRCGKPPSGWRACGTAILTRHFRRRRSPPRCDWSNSTARSTRTLRRPSLSPAGNSLRSSRTRSCLHRSPAARVGSQMTQVPSGNLRLSAEVSRCFQRRDGCGAALHRQGTPRVAVSAQRPAAGTGQRDAADDGLPRGWR